MSGTPDSVDPDGVLDVEAVLDVLCLLAEEQLEHGGTCDEEDFSALRDVMLVSASIDEGLVLLEITHSDLLERIIDRWHHRDQREQQQRERAISGRPTKERWPNPPGIRRRRVMIGHRKGWLIEPDTP
jgi:hypothetical protein